MEETTPNNIPAITTKIAKMRYSAFKNAKAPSLMYLAIFAIFSVPLSCFSTQLRSTNM